MADRRQKRPGITEAVKNFINAGTPDDEYIYADDNDFEDVSSGSTTEIPAEEIMQVFNAGKTKKVDKTSESQIFREERTRVKSLVAPTPEQIEIKTNEYLNKVETDPRLNNLHVEDVKYAANDQGYSSLVVMKMLVEVDT